MATELANKLVCCITDECAGRWRWRMGVGMDGVGARGGDRLLNSRNRKGRVGLLNSRNRKGRVGLLLEVREGWGHVWAKQQPQVA